MSENNEELNTEAPETIDMPEAKKMINKKEDESLFQKIKDAYNDIMNKLMEKINSKDL